MCGIAGFNWNDKTLIKRMSDCIIHRGPDDEGFYCDERVSLGHRRLSIIDLSAKGKQPMEYDDCFIIFNGEIYNFPELKKELVDKGHHFISGTDTEVILHAYREYGEKCVEKLNGMWTFCIYDKKKNSLFLSRDRFGEKPLYYYSDSDKFIFASEIKAIRQQPLNLTINTRALNFYFYQKYIGGDLSIFNSVYKLKPGHNLVYDLITKSLLTYPYYHLEKEIEIASTIPVDEKLKLIKELIPDATEKRLIADVPVGSFLSGGIDSSLISAIIAKKVKHFKTFSIGFKERSFDELPYSKAVAKHINTDHQYEYVPIDEKVIEQVIGNLDEPFGDSSIIPVYLLSKMTRKNVTVSLSGDAGDEVFGGYDTYMGLMIAKHFPGFLRGGISAITNLFPPSDKKVSFLFKVNRFLGSNDKNIGIRHLNWMATFQDRDRRLLLNGNFIPANSLILPATNAAEPTSKDELLTVQLNDIHNYLAEDILKKTDVASMMNSLEVRVPFLDHRLVPLVLSLPDKYKIRGFKTKWLLKKLAHSYIPGKIINRKKRGFTVPVSKWIKESELIKRYLTGDEAYVHGMLNKKYIIDLYTQHINNKKDNARQLWLTFVFNYWWEKSIYDRQHSI